MAWILGIREGVDQVSRVEVPESTRQALAPMSNDAYLAMIASTGGVGINAVPPIQQRDEPVEEIEVRCLTEQEETGGDERAKVMMVGVVVEKRRKKEKESIQAEL